MTSARTIRHVDAFTTTPLEGNPAAVVDGAGLDAETMQRIALNQHLSETVFLFCRHSPRRITRTSASSRRGRSCRSPAIRRSRHRIR